MGNFKEEDVVVSTSRFSRGREGVVWKVSEYGVHVNFGTIKEPSYQVFHFSPTHHMQSNITEITILNQKQP